MNTNALVCRDRLGHVDQGRVGARRVPLALGFMDHHSDAVTTLDRNRALVFGEVAEEYARWRPTYPDEAVAWLARDARTVVDLGAGTGQLTGVLLDRGLTVHAVERDPRMLSVLGTQFPAARRHESGADQIPLPDHSVDAILSADAWHWFPEATIAEVRRVLRPGGWLGLVWNKVTPIQPWEYDLAGIDPDKKGLEDDTASDGDADGPFPAAETEVEAFPWAWRVTPAHIRGYLATNSAVIRLDDEGRRAKLDRSQEIMARACAELGTSTAPLHHEAYCVRWVPAAR